MTHQQHVSLLVSQPGDIREESGVRKASNTHVMALAKQTLDIISCWSLTDKPESEGINAKSKTGPKQDSTVIRTPPVV